MGRGSLGKKKQARKALRNLVARAVEMLCQEHHRRLTGYGEEVTGAEFFSHLAYTSSDTYPAADFVCIYCKREVPHPEDRGLSDNPIKHNNWGACFHKDIVCQKIWGINAGPELDY